MELPVKVYVGTQREQMLACRVLEYSIQSRTKAQVEVLPLFEAIEVNDIRIPVPGDPKKRARTPFSFQRFAIPELKGYSGRAIYLDSDMIVFNDIVEIWTWPIEGIDMLSVKERIDSSRRPQFSVMVLNCTRLKWNVTEIVNGLGNGKWTYSQLVYEMAPASVVSAELPPGWNELENFVAGETALLHYTDMNRQPWLSTKNPYAVLWCKELLSAVREGWITRRYIESHVRDGWVRPSLLYQIDNEIADPRDIPAWVVQSDRRNFIPPHMKASGIGRSAVLVRLAGKFKRTLDSLLSQS